jgi:hypothetical protein
MPTITRTITLLLAALALALVPGLAVAKHGADDGPSAELGDDNGGDRPDGVSDDTQRDDNDGDASRDDDKRVAGNCTGSATSKLKAKPDDGRLEVEFEVDQNRTGVTWKVRIRRNGKRVVKTRATTSGRSGSFSVERKIGNPAGSDDIAARAISPSGQVCQAKLTI